MKMIRRISLMVVGLVALVYAGDYAAARFRIPGGHEPLGVVRVQTYYAVPLKSGKSDLYFQDPQQQTCVNSWFPHRGYDPCWYVKRHARQRIEM
jgi:hypothetical protein